MDRCLILKAREGTSGRRGKLLFFLDGEAEASREDAGKRIADQTSNIQSPKSKWGCSSAGRAPALQAGGHRFEPVHLHHGQGWETTFSNQEMGL